MLTNEGLPCRLNDSDPPDMQWQTIVHVPQADRRCRSPRWRGDADLGEHDTRERPFLGSVSVRECESTARRTSTLSAPRSSRRSAYGSPGRRPV
jgi:hypothetical protein